MEPLGLVKDEYVRNTITTSSIPLYQTKNLGLTQYTPNRYTSYLTNYNEDMRKIDRFSTSIGAYIEKTLDEADAEHQRLDERINNTNSVLAFTEKRVDNVEEALTELETDIAQVRVEIHEAVADSEERMTDLISQSIAATSSTLAYLDKKIDENDTKQTLAYSGLSQRMHVAEDEIKTLKESSTSYLEDITNLQTAATNLETRVTSLEELEQVNHEDIVNAQKKLMAHDTELASLANTETVQNQTIATLTEQVAALNTIGEDVNNIKNRNYTSTVTYVGPGYSQASAVGTTTVVITSERSCQSQLTIKNNIVNNATSVTSNIKFSETTGDNNEWLFIPTFYFIIDSSNDTQDQPLKELNINITGINARRISIGQLRLNMIGTRTITDAKIKIKQADTSLTIDSIVMNEKLYSGNNEYVLVS